MVERSEIDQMAKFMQAMNGTSATASPLPSKTKPTATSNGDPSIAAMKTILERFHRASDAVCEESTFDRELREALVTEVTDHGSRIGGWEITVKQNGKRKAYDVTRVGEQTAIMADLMLYEAAHGLVRILNEGGKLNSRSALALLQAEQDYASALHDAVIFKHYLVKNPHGAKTPVYEARYGAATQRALTARERVINLSMGRI